VASELYIYLNGEIMEESRACISPFDRGFLWGDGVYEVTPCFNRSLYRLDDHLDRLYRSLRYVRIDPGLSRKEMENMTIKMHEINFPYLEPVGVCRVGHWITRGMDCGGMVSNEDSSPTVLIFWSPMKIESLAKNYTEGVKLAIVPTRRNPPQCIETRAKVTSKMNQILAELDAKASGSLPLMLDYYGNITENSLANFFMVRDGKLWTAPGKNILEGVTRKVVFEIASRLGIPYEERNFTLYDIAQAEEFFLTASPFCVMPVRQVDGFKPILPVPGPITLKLTEAFINETGFDFYQCKKD